MNIIRGKQKAPVRGLWYGVDGVGKTTLAAELPGAIIIDTEDGSGQLDVARVVALDWRSIEAAVKDLIKDSQGFSAVVIDTADWLEKALIEWMTMRDGKKSIEDYGYGKGYIILAEHFSKFLALCDQLIAKGLHVIFISHAKVQRTSPPDETDGYDRYEIQMTKQVAPLLKQWVDMIIFCNYKMLVVEGRDGRSKATGGKIRVMYAERTAAWDAKNRYSLPAEMPMEFAEIAELFTTPVPRAVPAKPVEPAWPVGLPPAGVFSSVPAHAATPEQLAELLKSKDNPVSWKIIEDGLEEGGCVTLGDLTQEKAASLLNQINQLTKGIGPNQSVLVGAWLDAHASKVNEYLVKAKWIQPGQSWKDMDSKNYASLVARVERFARAAGIPSLEGVAA